MALHCIAQKIGFTIENPTNSYLRMLPEYQLLAKKEGVTKVNFHACMWGARRPKMTSFLTNMLSMHSLARSCDGSHAHLPWGLRWKDGWSFATAEECEYPKQLCQAVASRAAESAGARKTDGPPRRCKPKTRPSVHTLEQRTVVGRQPKGRRIPPAIPEYRSDPFVLRTTDPYEAHKVESWPSRLESAQTFNGHQLPKGTKIIHKRTTQMVDGDGCASKVTEPTVGLHWTPKEFTAKAQEAVHPLEKPADIPDDLRKAVVDVLSLGPSAWKTVMGALLQTWAGEKETLAASERDLHENLASVFPSVEKVVKGKQLRLFKRMLAHLRYQDMKVADLMVSGFPVVGLLDEVLLFEKKPAEEATIGADPAWLTHMAKTLRALLVDQVKNAVVDDTHRRLYDKTNGAQNSESEVARQWADGPFSELEMIRRHGPLFLPCRRFGVQQGTDKHGNPKVRPIDDFSEYFHNSCVTSYDKVTVASVDAIANFAKLWTQLIHQAKHDEDWRFSVVLSTGEELRGVLHPGFREEESHRLVGKCLDLESAYRQLAVRPSQRHLAIFSLKNPVSGQVEFFECNALPFGASAAVHGFNRAAMALEKIMMSMFGIPCTHYFDDFSFIAPAAVAEPVLELAQEVLDLLGWEVKGETKDVPLDVCFTALGVSFDLWHATDYRLPSWS